MPGRSCSLPAAVARPPSLLEAGVAEVAVCQVALLSNRAKPPGSSRLRQKWRRLQLRRYLGWGPAKPTSALLPCLW